MALEIEINAGSTIVFGETIHFEASVSGENGSVEYQWTVDGENAAGENGSTFDYTPASVGAHNITCFATDEEPTTEESAISEVPTKSVYETMQGTLSYLAKIAKAI